MNWEKEFLIHSLNEKKVFSILVTLQVNTDLLKLLKIQKIYNKIMKYGSIEIYKQG